MDTIEPPCQGLRYILPLELALEPDEIKAGAYPGNTHHYMKPAQQQTEPLEQMPTPAYTARNHDQCNNQRQGCNNDIPLFKPATLTQIHGGLFSWQLFHTMRSSSLNWAIFMISARAV